MPSFSPGAVISRIFKQMPASKSIGEVLEWSASPVYQGYNAVFAFGESNIHEMIVSVNVASTAWVNFRFPHLILTGGQLSTITEQPMTDTLSFYLPPTVCNLRMRIMALQEQPILFGKSTTDEVTHGYIKSN